MTSNEYIRLLRPQQWYKNLLIFLPLLFSNNLFVLENLFLCVIGFFSLCLVSSSYYILNDIKDVNEDKRNPEKKKRPIASGEIGTGMALLIFLIAFVSSMGLSLSLSSSFFAFPVLLFTLNIFYTLGLKNIPLVDINIISFNFVLRAASGAVLIGVPVSPWLIITIYILALFLAVGKRKGELFVLGKDPSKHKKVYTFYNEKFLDFMTIILSTSLFISYILYTFMADIGIYMLLTVPFAGFMIFRYMHFVISGTDVSRKTEYFFRDRHMQIYLVLWFLTLFLVLYAPDTLEQIFSLIFSI